MEDGRYIRLETKNVKLHLTTVPLPDSGHEALCRMDWALLYAQRKMAVEYAGPLAGYKPGEHLISGRRVLVSRGFELVTPKAGQFPFLEKFLWLLFGKNDAQMLHFCTWLGLGFRALSDGSFRPGQLSAFCGPPGQGKSFLHWIITQALGGRMAKPYKWMTAQTAFNADLAEAESLVIDDENGNTDIRSRRAFGSTIKMLTVGGELDIHGKGRQAIALPTFRRLHMSLNSNPEALCVCPPMDEDIAGKVNLYRTHLIPIEEKALHEDRLENQRVALAELPALIHFCLGLKVKAADRDTRFGIRAFHDPELLENLSELSPETKLLGIIDGVVDFKDGPWKGTADDLEKEVRDSEMKFAADRLLSWQAACGSYLARLASKYPQRFTRTKSGNRVSWTITAP